MGKKIGLSLALVLAAAAAMGGSVWYLKRALNSGFLLRSAQAVQSARSRSQDALDLHVRGLEDLSRRAPEEFKDSAAQVLRENAGFAGVNRLDDRFIVRDVFPYDAGRAALGLDLKSRFDALSVAQRALTRRSIAVSDLVDIVQGGKGLLLYAPIFGPERWAGFIEGAFRLGPFAAHTLDDLLSGEYRYTILDESNGRELFTSLAGGPPYTALDAYFTLRAADRTWWVILHPLSPPNVLLPVVMVLLFELGVAAVALRLLWKK